MTGAPFRNARVLVAGGAGFIGSHVVDALVAAGARVTVLDDFSSGRRENLAGVEGAIRVVDGDLCDPAIRAVALPGTDVLMHLATRCLRISLSNPEDVFRVNCDGTHQLYLDAVRHGVGRIVYVSSSEVYGTAVSAPMSEDHPLDPTTVYGATKLAGEIYARAIGRSAGIDTVVIRPFNTYGPRAHFEGVYGEVIPRFTVRVLNGRAPLIFGDGLQTRDFTYVSDTVHGILLAAAARPATGEPVNIARGEEVSIRTLALLIGRALGSRLEPEYLPPRPSDVHRHLAGVERAEKTLGFRAAIGIEEGLRRYVEWFRAAYPDPAACEAQAEAKNW